MAEKELLVLPLARIRMNRIRNEEVTETGCLKNNLGTSPVENEKRADF